MQTPLVFCLVVFTSTGFVCAQSQSASNPAPRDQTAVSLLQASITAMGAAPPADSTASGTISYVSGSLSEIGTIQILTRGTSQSLEQFVTPHVNRTIVYSQLQASVTNEGETDVLPLQSVVTSQSLSFPLPYLVGVYGDPDVAIQYVGLESLNGVSVQHLRLWDTFNSQTFLQVLSSLTTRDLWLDATSSLPVQISFGSWSTTNIPVSIPVTITYSRYQTFGEFAYPTAITKSVNGISAITTTIQSVKFDTGLTNSSFPIS